MAPTKVGEVLAYFGELNGWITVTIDQLRVHQEGELLRLRERGSTPIVAGNVLTGLQLGQQLLGERKVFLHRAASQASIRVKVGTRELGEPYGLLIPRPSLVDDGKRPLGAAIVRVHSNRFEATEAFVVLFARRQPRVHPIKAIHITRRLLRVATCGDSRRDKLTVERMQCRPKIRRIGRSDVAPAT